MNDDSRLTIMRDTSVTDWRQRRYSDEMKELARACYIEANANADKAWRYLCDACQATTDAERAAMPSSNAIRRWARKDGWEQAFTQDVADDYPATFHHLTARFIRMAPAVLDQIELLTIDPDYQPRKGDMVRADLLKFVATVLGLGTLGMERNAGTVTVSVQRNDQVDVQQMTPAELARYQREQLGSGG